MMGRIDLGKQLLSATVRKRKVMAAGTGAFVDPQAVIAMSGEDQRRKGVLSAAPCLFEGKETIGRSRPGALSFDPVL